MAARAERRIARLVSTWAGALAASLVIVPAGLVFLLSSQRVAGSLEAEAELRARAITQIIGSNPDLWQYEQLRISEYLSRTPRERHAEVCRVLDLRGEVVAQSAAPLAPPAMKRSVPLFDAGVRVGTVEVSRSLRWLLVLTGGIAFAVLPVSILAFHELRTVPLRAIAESEAALRRERDTARRYLDVAPVAFVTQDRTGHVSLLNHEAALLLGRSVEEVIGEDWEGFVDPGDRARVAAATASAGPGELVRVEYAVVRPDGQRRNLSWCVTPIPGADGAPTGLLACGVDITPQRRLEERLRHAESLGAFGQLAGDVAHELGRILGAIATHATALRGAVPAGSPHSGDVEEISAAARRASALTRALLVFGRRQDVRPEPLDLGEVVRQSATHLRRVAGDDVALEIDAVPSPLPILGDGVQLVQVLTHLVSSARGAAAGGGRIVVSASRVSLDEEGARRAGLDAPGPYARISVAGAGAGADADGSGAPAGSGTPSSLARELVGGPPDGLVIASAVVKRHGGAIQVSSEPPRGTNLTVLLPVLAVPAVARGRAAPPAR